MTDIPQENSEKNSSDSEKSVSAEIISDSSRVGSSAPRVAGEIPVSTIVRMMGLPTKHELALLEQKIDALTGKINILGSKLERIVSNFEHGSEFDRIDVQLTDIRTTLREVLPKIVSQLSGSGSRAAVKKNSAEDAEN